MASDGLAEDGAGKAVLISVVEVGVAVGAWVDIGFEGFTGFPKGVGVWVTTVTGLIGTGMGVVF